MTTLPPTETATTSVWIGTETQSYSKRQSNAIPAARHGIERHRDIGFYPKPFQQPRIPLWVGGEGKAAQRRNATYGDAWFPYLVGITPG